MAVPVRNTNPGSLNSALRPPASFLTDVPNVSHQSAHERFFEIQAASKAVPLTEMTDDELRFWIRSLQDAQSAANMH